MQSIGAKVQVGDDRKVTLQLPEALPKGEYEVMLVWSPVNQSPANASEPSKDVVNEESIAERWKKWFDEVDQLPIKENDEEKSFHQHLVEKYRKQGMNL